MALSAEALRQVLKDVLAAGMVRDPDRLVAGIKPVFATGDGGDLYALVRALVAVVANTAPPSASCPDHEGCTCRPVYTFGVLPTVDGAPDWSAVAEGDTPSLPPGFEASHPEMVAYVRLVTAALADDEDMSVAVWCAAAKSGHGPEVLYHAIEVASNILRRKFRAGLS